MLTRRKFLQMLGLAAAVPAMAAMPAKEPSFTEEIADGLTRDHCTYAVEKDGYETITLEKLTANVEDIEQGLSESWAPIGAFNEPVRTILRVTPTGLLEAVDPYWWSKVAINGQWYYVDTMEPIQLKTGDIIEHMGCTYLYNGITCRSLTYA